MEENFNNIENIEINNEEEELTSKKKIFKFIIIFLFSIIIVIIIFTFLYSFLTIDHDNNKDIYICEEGKDDKCSKCENNKCISCNPNYDLIDGKCKATFSFRATYETTRDNENIDLIYINFENKIIKMKVDEKEEKPSKNYTFQYSGNHTVYMLINITDLIGVSLMFYQVENLTSIYFSKEFDTKNFKFIGDMFFNCKKLASVDISNFNTENVVYI